MSAGVSSQPLIVDGIVELGQPDQTLQVFVVVRRCKDCLVQIPDIAREDCACYTVV